MSKVQMASEEEPVLRQLDRWWFGYGSPTTLGLFRILIGVLAAINFLMLAGDWWDWYSEYGFIPAWLGRAQLGLNQPIGIGNLEIPRLDLIAGVTDPRIGIAFFVATIVFAVLTALGLWTRVSAFCLAVGVISLHHRSPWILHGGDTLLRMSVIYLAVSPAGRACSIDRLIRIRKGQESGPVEISLWPQRLLQVNLAIVYITTVWAKWFGSKWMDGTATYYPARLAEFYRFPVPKFFNDFPMVYFTTYGTLFVEFSLGTLVFFRPLRKWCLLAGVLLHGFIEYSMNIPLFSYLMVTWYISHYDGEEIAEFLKRLGNRLRPKTGLKVFLPKDRKLEPAGAEFLDAVDPMGLVEYLPGQQETWSAERVDGQPRKPFRGAIYRSVGAWIFALVPGLWRRTVERCTEPA